MATKARWSLKEMWHTLVQGVDRFDLVAGMTLVLLFFATDRVTWYATLGVHILAVLGILFRLLRQSAVFWIAIALLLGVSLLRMWHAANNHDFLIAYWCLAIGCSRLANDPEHALAFNARMLIGLCFASAVLWRMTTVEFIDGSFFNFIPIFDNRFEGLAKYVGGVSSDFLLHSGRQASAYWAYGDALAGFSLATKPFSPWLGYGITYWILIIEGAVAFCFLWPEGRSLSQVRNAVLLVFIIATYTLIPILYFGWVLLAMGTAQAHSVNWRRWGILYAAALLWIITLFHFPFRHLLSIL